MHQAFLVRLAILVGALGLAGCDASRSQETTEKGERAPGVPPVIRTIALKPSHETVKIEGVATVLNPDQLLQIDADIRGAKVAADFSSGQLARFRQSTSLSRQSVANAERQEAMDASQLKLLEERLRQTWGDEAPFLEVDSRQKLIAAIGEGSRAVVRLDLPDYPNGKPRNVRVMPLHGGAESAVETIWPAPSGNLAMPGASFFGLIAAKPGLRAGDRARLVADSPDGGSGVVIPNSAIVVFASQSWCYVETAPKKYERKPVALERPVEGGYLVRDFEPGTQVVVRGASILLAREAQPSEGDDDDHPSGTPQPEPKPAASAAVVQPEHASAARSDPE